MYEENLATEFAAIKELLELLAPLLPYLFLIDGVCFLLCLIGKLKHKEKRGVIETLLGLIACGVISGVLLIAG